MALAQTPTRFDQLSDVVVCPCDHGALDADATGLTCKVCMRTYPTVKGVVNFLAFEEAFMGLTYDLPHHPVPVVSRSSRTLSKIRSLPIYHRLLVTSDYFSFTLERSIYRAMKKHKAILDIGCREGRNLLFGGSADICIGVDIDLNSAYYTQQISPRNAWAFLASGTRLPFASGTFDLVLCCDVIEHVEEYGDMVKEIGRVTQKGGVLILSTPDGEVLPKPAKFHVKHFKWIELADLLRPHFAQINCRSIVRNCGVRQAYWSFSERFPGRKLEARVLNACTNLRFYLGGYHKEGSCRRPDVTDATFIVTALKT